MVHKTVTVALLGCLLSLLSAAGAFASPTTEVEKYLNGLATWSADFAQTIDDGHGKVVRSAAGKLSLQKPGKFRWDYSQPSEQLILADGKQIWFYDKDLQQANVREMDASLANTPAVLLSQLVPKHADTDFQLVRIGFRHGDLASMFLADKLNQITQLTFSNPSRNAKFAADLFTFVPPPGVDVIGRAGK